MPMSLDEIHVLRDDQDSYPASLQILLVANVGVYRHEKIEGFFGRRKQAPIVQLRPSHLKSTYDFVVRQQKANR